MAALNAARDKAGICLMNKGGTALIRPLRHMTYDAEGFLSYRKYTYTIKTLREDRTAVAKVECRRSHPPQAENPASGILS